MRDEFQTGMTGQTNARQGVSAQPQFSDTSRSTRIAPRAASVIARLIRGHREADVAEDPTPPPQMDARPPEVSRRRISPRPPAAEMPPPVVSPAASPAPKKRWGRMADFGLCVLVPLVIIAIYMIGFARPQYASDTAFTIRSGEMGGVTDALSGFAQMAGAPRNTDAMILVEFLQSQTLLERLNARLDLVRHYAEPSARDPIFALWPGATVEARLNHWQRMVQVRNDPGSGVIELRVRAFSPEMAQLVARELLVESRRLLNELNAEIQAASSTQAQAELIEARVRLEAARHALTEFRSTSQILDPNSDFQSRAAVLRHLQDQLALALVAQAAPGPEGSVGGTDRVETLRAQIDAERGRLFAENGRSTADYPTLLATHERLAADRDIAQIAYGNARVALDIARAQAARQDLFLAVFVEPTLAERPDFGRTAQIIGLAALFLVLFWAIASLLRAAVRDRR